MMTENEVLEKLALYKDAIIRIKNERDEAKQKAEELQLKLDTQNENYMQDSKESWEKADHWERLYNDLKEKSYHTIKHLVEDNIEVKEKEIEDLKDDLQNMNSRFEESEKEWAVRDQNWVSKFSAKAEELQGVTSLLEDKDYLISKLQTDFNVRVFNETDEQALQNAQTRVKELEDQIRQTKYSDDQSKAAFLNEIERVVKEADEILNQES